MKTVYTFCRICLAGCGVEVTVDEDNRIQRIAPDKQNPYTWRDFCAKARTAHELVEHPRRILAPMKRVGDSYVEASWDEAVSDIASRLRTIMDRHGPDAIGCYWGNPAGFSASNPMFMAGLLDAIGTRNRYFVGSIDQNNYHVVAEAMYGSPLLVLIPDVDQSKCLLFIGMNPAVSAMNWLENLPNGWRRVLAAQAEGTDLIVVDPRRTATAEKADTHIAIRPGGDWAFLLGLLKVIFDKGWEDSAECDRAHGVDGLRALAAEADLDDLSRRCDVPAEDIADVARRFALAPTAACVAHTGVSQNVNGTLGEWLSHALNLVTGRLDKPGGRRYERGYVDSVGLFAKLAPALPGVSRLRGLPSVAGYHSLAELPDEITTPGPGQIRALVLDCGNPVVSGPDGAALDHALSTLDLLVAVDLVQRESHRHAHWLIPGAHWLEREDLHALTSGLNDQPYAMLGPKAVEPPPQVREEWEFFTDLALAMGVPLFGKKGVNGVVKATRRLARLTGRPALAFNPRWIDRLLVMTGRRLKWKDIVAHPHGWIYGEREYGNLAKALRTPDKRVHAAPPQFLAEARRQLATPPPQAPSEFPLILSNRRSHDSMNSWLNELPGLHKHGRGNELEINPVDAGGLGIDTGDTVRVSSPLGAIELTARVSDAIRSGVVCCEHGWGSRVFDPAGREEPVAYGANRNLLVNNRDIDPLSQTPALNSTPVRVEKVSTA
ncbi:MAG: molybdopterin-containing oxidoreductase family protein [Acidimicrobiia bacterium]